MTLCLSSSVTRATPVAHRKPATPFGTDDFRDTAAIVGNFEPRRLIGDEGVRGWAQAGIVIQRGERYAVARRRVGSRSAIGVPALNLWMIGAPQTLQNPRKEPGVDS